MRDHGMRCGRRRRFLIPLAIAVISGCQEGEPSWFDRGKTEAEARWNQVRGEVRLTLARQALERGQLEEAAAQVASAESDGAEPAGAALLKAEIAVARGEWGAAEPLLRRIVNEDPADGRAHYLLGAVLEQAGHTTEALEAYRKAAELTPARVEAALAAAECMLSVGDAGAALAWLEARGQADRSLYSDPAFVLLVAESFRMVGAWDQASSTYVHAIQLGADDAGTFARAAEAFLARGDYAEALKWIEPALEDLESPPVSLLLARARCLLETGRVEQARTMLGVLLRDHEDAGAWLLLAEAWARSGRLDPALRNVERALEVAADNATAHQLQAALAVRAGDPDLALAAARRAVELAPRDALSHCVLGAARRKAGEIDAAAAAYQRALDLDPNCAEAASALPAIRREHAGPGLAQPKS